MWYQWTIPSVLGKLLFKSNLSMSTITWLKKVIKLQVLITAAVIVIKLQILITTTKSHHQYV